MQFDTLRTYVSELILNMATYLPTFIKVSKTSGLFHCRVSVWLCQCSNAEIIFSILALEWTPSPLKHTQHVCSVHMQVQQRISRRSLCSAAGVLNVAAGKLISVLKFQLLTYLHRDIIILHWRIKHFSPSLVLGNVLKVICFWNAHLSTNEGQNLRWTGEKLSGLFIVYGTLVGLRRHKVCNWMGPGHKTAR